MTLKIQPSESELEVSHRRPRDVLVLETTTLPPSTLRLRTSPMSSAPSAPSAYLRLQYENGDRLSIRTETHRLYSEAPDRLHDELLRHLQLKAGLRVLDVGCGPGRYHAAIAERGAPVIGLDTSPGMLREARARAAANSPVQLAQADA
jgi:SAM-dependent methyltransferase